MHRRLCIFGWLAVTVLTSGMANVPCGAEVEEIFPLAEVAPGLTGYGLSVFSGFEPERFEVEVIGVWRDLQPGTSYILARLTGMGLEDSGVVAGMSGSPVFLDGRLAGAVAIGWPFSHDAVAGIMPIESMREMAMAGSQPSAPAAGANILSIDQLAAGDLPQDLIQEGLSLLGARAPGFGGSGVLWSTVGFGERTRQLLSESLGSVAAAGQTTATGPDLVPGASVAGVLIDGDLRIAATGTVTDRSGEQILAFGHPFLGLGAVRIPMATAEVVTILSNQFQSFKVSNLGQVVGAFDLDRMTGIRGRLGLDARTLPVTISVRGDREQDFQLRLANVPSIAPILMAISMLGSLEATTQAAGDQGLDLLARFDLADNGELTVRQSFDGQSAAFEAAIHLLAYTGFMLNNRLERVEIRAIEVELIQYSEPRTARLVEAHAAQTVVGPGDRVPLNFDLMAYRGDRFRRSLELEVPTGIPDGRYSLLVGDGVSVDVARLMIERSEPINFRQALDFLRSLHSRRELVVLGVFGGPGLAVAGEILPQLPHSMRSIWGAAASGSAVPLRLAVAQERVIRLDVPVEGILRIDLEVRRQGPLASDADEAPEGGENPDTSVPVETSGKAAGGLN